MRKCKVCGSKYDPVRPMQTVCGFDCAVVEAAVKTRKKNLEDGKKERTETREKLAKLKTRSDLLKDAQTSFNAMIRHRDKDDPCISCGRHHQGQYHAGHYLSVGARPELRFDPSNVHKQCQPCNTHLHGNLIMYRVRLIQKIGHAEVDRLEGPNEAKHYSRDNLIEMAKEYRKKLR